MQTIKNFWGYIALFLFVCVVLGCSSAPKAQTNAQLAQRPQRMQIVAYDHYGDDAAEPASNYVLKDTVPGCEFLGVTNLYATHVSGGLTVTPGTCNAEHK